MFVKLMFQCNLQDFVDVYRLGTRSRKNKKITPFSGGKKLIIESSELTSKSNIGDSIAVNGVCLTAESAANNEFSFHVISTSLEKTSLNNLKSGSLVNLEPCLSLQDPLGGHLVSGHVNAIGRIENIINEGTTKHIWVNFESSLRKYMVMEGSVALDGISLTIADLKANKLKVSIIPHTWENTNLKNVKIGDEINIEIDLLAKYVENLLRPYKQEARL